MFSGINLRVNFRAIRVQNWNIHLSNFAKLLKYAFNNSLRRPNVVADWEKLARKVRNVNRIRPFSRLCFVHIDRIAKKVVPIGFGWIIRLGRTTFDFERFGKTRELHMLSVDTGNNIFHNWLFLVLILYFILLFFWKFWQKIDNLAEIFLTKMEINGKIEIFAEESKFCQKNGKFGKQWKIRKKLK